MKCADRTMPLLRLGLFFLACGALVSAVLLGSADADVARFPSSGGAESMTYPGTRPDRARVLQLNGVPVSFRTQTVAAPLEDVLGHYESLCIGGGAGLAERLSMQSHRGKDGGHVACLDMGDGPRNLRSLAGRFVRFSQTGDLTELGGLRYARARRVSSTSGDQTFVLTVWADSAFPIFRMLAVDGADAAGKDIEAVPRPRSAQRLLSAWEVGSPSGFVVYRVLHESAAALESFYRNQLSAKGWTVIERHPSESFVIDGIRTISAERANRTVTVLAHSSDATGTVVSVLISQAS